MTGIGGKMVKGVRWSALEKGGQQAITFVVFAILARFVAPEDFGLVAMALIMIGFVQLFIDQGFSTAIVQRESVDDEFLSTAFWANCAIGIVLGGMLLALTDATAWFFDEPRVSELIPWMALALLFEALMAVPQALLKRRFDFRGLALRTALARVIAGSIAIAGAVSGLGVWSLVLFTVMSGALSTLILWWISEWRPRLMFSMELFRDLLRFGGHVTGVRILSYVGSRILDILIGYFFGAVALGYYTLAWQLVGRIGAVMVQVLSQVTMSGFSRAQADGRVLLRHLLGVNRLTAALVFPLFALVGALAGDLVILVYGGGWGQSAILISLLAPIGPAMVMISSLGDVTMSAGAPQRVLRARTVATVLMVTLLFLMLPWGLEALTAAFAASFYLFTLPLHILAAQRVIPLRVGSYVLQQIPIVVATAAMIAVVLLMESWSAMAAIGPWGAAMSALAGSAVYVLAILSMDRQIMVDLRRVVSG